MESMSYVLIDRLAEITKEYNSNNPDCIKKLSINYYISRFASDASYLSKKDAYTAYDIYAFTRYLHCAETVGILPTIPEYSYKYFELPIEAEGTTVSGYLHAKIISNNEILKITITPVINTKKIGDIRIHTEIEKDEDDPVKGKTTKIKSYDFTTKEIAYISLKERNKITNENEVIEKSACMILRGIMSAFNLTIEKAMRRKYYDGKGV